MSNDELEIRNLIDTWCQATEAGDVDALTPLMADDMVFLTPGPRVGLAFRFGQCDEKNHSGREGRPQTVLPRSIRGAGLHLPVSRL
jgi:ketosteroid isomerase-like protein